ncbi:MAG: AAA family ATPase [Planctomycetota bacterium]|jgi:transitional endoplasmic reticulum ATPase
MSRDMLQHWMDQIPDLEDRYKRAKARGDWSEGASCLREAAKVQESLCLYYFERARKSEERDNTSDAEWARKEGSRRLTKAEAWAAKANRISELGGFPAPAKREAVEGGADDEVEKKESDWLLKEKPEITFDDIAGLEDAKEQIRVRMVYPFLNPDLAEKYGIKKGGGILLYGPPGTGKTMLAKAVAAEIDAAFYTVRPSEIMSKWVGESEQNIRRLFKEARMNPSSIIFIDEVEALLPPRGGESPPVMKRLVPQILGELEGIDTAKKNPLLFVGATNEPWNIDVAILRPGRFDEKVYIGLPDESARAEILRMNLREKPIVDVDFTELVERTEGFSGADIRNLCQKTANTVFLEAIRTGEDRDITMNDLLNTLTKIHPSVNSKLLDRFEEFTQGKA